MSENNNLPAEYVPIMSMVQKEESIRKGISVLKEKILVSAGDEFESWNKEKQDQFFERTILSIAKDEKLADCFLSPEGKLSIIEAVEKAVSTGLQIGGKHAYLVPQGKKVKRNGKDEWVKEVRFSIRDRGYYALLCGGKKPIFQDLRWGSVFEKDDCSVNKGTGEVKHNVAIADNKGKFLGCWVQARKINGQLEAEFYPVSKIEQWRNSSKAYLDAVKYNNQTPWIEWREEMSLGACIRHFSARYEEARELLSSALYDEDQTEEKNESPIDRIENALNRTEPDIEPDEEIHEEVKKEPVKSTKPDLF